MGRKKTILGDDLRTSLARGVAESRYEKGGSIFLEEWTEEMQIECLNAYNAFSKTAVLQATKKVIAELHADAADDAMEYNDEVAAAEGEEVDEEVDSSASVIDQSVKDQYGEENNCGDAVAKNLLRLLPPGKDTTENEAVCGNAFRQDCIRNDIDPDRCNHLNSGMRRMNLGNVLRGMLKRGEDVSF